MDSDKTTEVLAREKIKGKKKEENRNEVLRPESVVLAFHGWIDVSEVRLKEERKKEEEEEERKEEPAALCLWWFCWQAKEECGSRCCVTCNSCWRGRRATNCGAGLPHKGGATARRHELGH